MENTYYLKDYIEAVKNFVNDTKNWGNLDTYKHYVAVSSNWIESEDNQENGLNLAWSFKKENLTNSEIVEEFYKQVINILNSNIENDVDYLEFIKIKYN